MLTRGEVIDKFSEFVKEHGLSEGNLIMILDCCLREMSARDCLRSDVANAIMTIIYVCEGKE